jgi:pimeloyl-ACP methyl ester carboxylesterase
VSSRIARAVDGEPLAFEIVGGAAGPGRGEVAPMLTAHGLVSGEQHFRYLVPYFARTRPVVTWQYRGHGGQPPPRERRVSVEEFAEDGHVVWREAGVGPAVVVGLSFGVQVALEMWRAHPEMVRALVLICGTPGHPLDRIASSPGLRWGAAAAMRRLGGAPGFGAFLRPTLGSRLGLRLAREVSYLTGGALRGAGPDAVLEALFAHVAGLDPRLVGNVVAAYLEHTAEDVLETIEVPTLVIAGDRDQLTPVSIAERMQRKIRGSELVVFPGHTHLVQVEVPDEVHAVIEGFVTRHRV